MKLGLFLDMRNPPASGRTAAARYRLTLERVVAAERAGLDAVWMTEHHFFPDGYLPQPLTLAAAVAAVTERVRVGTAIVIAALRDPLHLAEEAAVVDLISGGRLELGIGAGWSGFEYEAFGADISRRYPLTSEATAEVRRLLDEDGVTPAPVQRPFPLWMGFQGPRGARRAGLLGTGLLSLDRELLAPYREGLAEGGHDPAAARMGGLAEIFVARDPEAARARILPAYAEHLDGYARARARDAGAEHRPVDAAAAAKGPLLVLTPEAAVAEIRERVAGLPVEHVYTWLGFGAMDDDLVEEHLELWLGEVRPALAAEPGDAGAGEA